MPSESADNRTSPEAKRYQAMKNRLFLFNLLLDFSFCFLLLSTGLSRHLKSALLYLRDDFFSINALYFTAFSVLALILFLPLEFYEGFVLEHRFGLSRQKKMDWLKDVLKRSTLFFVVSLVIVEAIYFFLSEFPRHWWFWAALAWFFVSVLVAKIFPSLIIPLFFRATPLSDGPLRDKVALLLDRYNIRYNKISVLDFSKKTVKANAMVAGLGATKQIFFSDTLVQEFPIEEIEVVLAHEIGHYIHKDTIKLLMAGLGSALLSFFAASIVFEKLTFRLGFSAVSDIASLPLLLILFLFLSLILLPLQNGYSRFLESRADRFALAATGQREAFISVMKRLGQKNFSEFSPSRGLEIFLYDHPPLAKRIKSAESFSFQKNHEV